MPMYTWIVVGPEKFEKVGTKVDVLRSFEEYKEGPTEEESGLTTEEYSKAKWDRIIDTSPQVIRAPGFGAKGYW